MRRRTLLSSLALVTAAPALVACGAGDDAGDGAEQQSGAGARAAGAFPVTLTHAFGESVVPAAPQRVVSVGVTEQDVLLQLGVVPIAVTEWYGEQLDATWPWAHDLLAGARPEVLDTSDGFEFERIAALAPDLIVATNAGLTRKDYDLLSQLAPTVASVAGSTRYSSPWPDQTLQIARALGREADGQAIVDRLAAAYAEVAAAHPEWAGRTATFSQGGPSDGALYVYPAGLSTSFLTDLGFVMTEGLEGYAPEVGSQAQISAENVALIEADVVVFATESAEMFGQLQEFSTVPTLPAVAENRTVYTDEVLAGALYFETPLSLAYVLDRLTPMLDLAARGQSPREYPA